MIEQRQISDLDCGKLNSNNVTSQETLLSPERSNWLDFSGVSQQSGILNSLLLASAPDCEGYDENPWVDIVLRPYPDTQGLRRNRSTSWTSPPMPRRILYSPKPLFSPPPNRKRPMSPSELKLKQVNSI